MFKELDPLLHSELRLAVMSVLISLEEADFVYLQKQTGASPGNLSIQLDKLNAAGYIEMEKTFRGKKPQPDVYVYQAEVFCDNGETITLNGNISLIL